MKNSVAAIMFMLLMVSPAFSYDVDTHEDLSQAALQRSILSSDNVLTDLGLKEELSAGTVQGFPNSEVNSVNRSVTELIRFGASWEDNRRKVQALYHFYDPAHSGRKLTTPYLVNLVLGGGPSPSWILEDDTSYGSDQPFSYRHARSYLFSALTNDTEVERNKYWGLTFQTLGHVIHHVQDMAQPQHARDDPHLIVEQLDTLCNVAPTADPTTCIAYKIVRSPSLYESFTNQIRSQLNFDGYSPVYPLNKETFNLPRKFWATVTPTEGTPTGAGMSEFSNRNFVTAGTNFEHTDQFSSPSIQSSTVSNVDVQVVCSTIGVGCLSEFCQVTGLGCSPMHGEITMVGTTVHDQLMNTDTLNQYASSYSVFNSDLDSMTNPVRPKAYTLNRFNYLAAHRFLIPRAVAYSAGMINYFFRGKLDFVDDPTAPGIKRIRNISADTMKGTFTIYYDGIDGKRYPVPSASWENTTLPPYSNTSTSPSDSAFGIPVTLTTPTNPSPKKEGDYLIVFSGDLGDEKTDVAHGFIGAVAAKAVFSPSGAFLVRPSYDPQDRVSGSRILQRGYNGEWAGLGQKNKVAGNVDWQGAYVGGKPTRVISWQGPRSRYFFNAANDSYTPVIYQNGALFSNAPANVLGAAITKDSNGKEWLVAVTPYLNQLGVFIRPNIASTDASLYDAATKPNGWKLIGTTAMSALGTLPITNPWFFNGSGKEGRASIDFMKAKISLSVTDDTNAQATFSTENLPSSPYAETTTDLSQARHLATNVNGTNDCSVSGARSAAVGWRWETNGDVTTVGQSVATILSIDFKDDVELVATSGLSRQYRSFGVTYDEQPVQTLMFENDGCAGAVINAASIKSDNGDDGTVSDVSTTKITIGASSITMPLLSLITISSSRNEFEGLNPNMNAVSCGSSYEQTRTTAIPNIIYMDLRDSTVATYRDAVKEVNQQSSGGCGVNSVGTNTTTHEEAIDVYSKGGLSTTVIANRTGPGNPCSGGCNGSADNFLLGFGLDSEGNRVYSIQARSLAIDGNITKSVNFLSNGALESVFPLAPTNATYFPIGVIK